MSAALNRCLFGFFSRKNFDCHQQRFSATFLNIDKRRLHKNDTVLKNIAFVRVQNFNEIIQLLNIICV